MALLVIFIFAAILFFAFFRFVFDLVITIVSGVFKIITTVIKALAGGYRR